MNFADDDIVIIKEDDRFFVGGEYLYFGDELEGIMILEHEVSRVITPDDEDYWDYFFNIEE